MEERALIVLAVILVNVFQAGGDSTVIKVLVRKKNNQRNAITNKTNKSFLNTSCIYH